MRRRQPDPRRCVVCDKEVRPPALHFCSVACIEAWIAKARERQPVLMAKKKP